MTEREIEQIVQVFQAVFDDSFGEGFMIGNRSLALFVRHFGAVVRRAPDQEQVFKHLIEDGPRERDRMLMLARDRGDVALLRDHPVTALTQDAYGEFSRRKPSPPDFPG
ncbi:hypothetical protein [Phenylobacterium sp.]|uniref:hypothetical protein n=1 Tax=Phenylobacterium sp. TaxID=1871053 RepID=UPI0026297CB5|nr:hypothetical protein [Phenylobacterium sp.]